jgi:hypothetical protein
MSFLQCYDKDGNFVISDRYVGIQYFDDEGKPDPKRKFLRWEEWVEFHDKLHREHHDILQKVLVRNIAHFVKEQIAPLNEQIAELQQTLEQFGYVGQWTEGVEYKRGNFCTLGGSLWHCNATTSTSRPTTDNSDWSLAVKRGRDGRAPDLAARLPHKP